ncbi:MAG: PrsW family glutamic-type intramembrane protease [Blastocatellia bacterium]
MLRLIIQSGSLRGRQFQLEQGDQAWLLIGRSDECVVRFEEPVVSTRHAMIAADGKLFHLLDQRSANGTFLNGSRVAETQLRSGDVISLGTTGPQLQVVIEDAPTTELTAPINSYATKELPPSNTSSIKSNSHSLSTGKWNVRETVHLVGFYDPDHDSGKRPLHSIHASVLFVICAVLGVMVMGLTVLNLGLVKTLAAGALAFVSVTIYLAVFLWLDRFDPEPFRTLAVAFVWGATTAIFISLLVNDSLEPRVGEVWINIVSAPLVEETTKALGVLLILLLFRHDFDSVVDGIVYAGVVALGFGAVENIIKYAQSIAHGGVLELVGTFAWRGVLAPFSHVLFTGMTGIGVGIARETHNRAQKFTAPVIGFSFAVLLHSIWNWLAGGELFLMGYVLLEVPLFVMFLGAIAYLVHREGRILKKTLAREVERGLITQHELDVAISVFRRTAWYLGALGDRKRVRARRQFLAAVAKLGLCHWHKARATEANCDTESFPMIAQLQAEIHSLRRQI